MSLYDNRLVVKSVFDAEEWMYSEEICTSSSGEQYCEFLLDFSDDIFDIIHYSVHVWERVCDISLSFSALPDCPADKVDEVGRLFAEYNYLSRFFTWRLNPSNCDISMGYSFFMDSNMNHSQEKIFRDLFKFSMDYGEERASKLLKKVCNDSSANPGHDFSIRMSF